MDKQVFIQNLEQVKRRKVLLMRIGLSILFVTLCASIWMKKAQVNPETVLIFKSVAIAIFAALVYVFVTMVQSMCRRLGLHCPNCNRNLSGPLSHRVLANDQCFRCGTRLF